MAGGISLIILKSDLVEFIFVIQIQGEKPANPLDCCVDRLFCHCVDTLRVALQSCNMSVIFPELELG